MSMAMHGLRRLAASAAAVRVVGRSQLLAPVSVRAHHSLSDSRPAQPGLDPLLFPPARLPGADLLLDPSSSIASGTTPFMQLMAVPKRKVTPSRKGKRNGAKALKPVPVVAKCKVCGRIKLPHFYCCSGEAKLEES